MQTMNKETFLDYKKRREREVNDFTHENCHWVFGNKQYEELLQKLNLTEQQLKEQYCNFYAGGIIKRDKLKEYEEMSTKHYNELKELMKDYDFAKSAFSYQLGNYECYISYRFDEVFGSLSLTESEVMENDTLRTAFKDAKHEYWEWCKENC